MATGSAVMEIGTMEGKTATGMEQDRHSLISRGSILCLSSFSVSRIHRWMRTLGCHSEGLYQVLCCWPSISCGCWEDLICSSRQKVKRMGTNPLRRDSTVVSLLLFSKQNDCGHHTVLAPGRLYRGTLTHGWP